MNRKFYLFCFYFMLNRMAWAIIWVLQGKTSMIEELWKGISDFISGQDGQRKLFIND